VVSLPIFLVEGFFFLLTNADVLLVGYFMRPEDVAVYFATVKTLALVHFVYFAVKAGAAQRYAQYAHSGDQARLAAFARDTVSWTFWPSLMMGGVVLFSASPCSCCSAKRSWPAIRFSSRWCRRGHPRCGRPGRKPVDHERPSECLRRHLRRRARLQHRAHGASHPGFGALGRGARDGTRHLP
jgi:hypothetical protein